MNVVAHDRNGNMTKIPKPDDWSAHYDLTYDAWNRLVKVMDGETTVATYGYDGRNFRITKTAGGVTRHYYYSSQWQVLEERLGTATKPDRQYVWGLRYVDDLVLRDRNADGNYNTGSLGKASSGLEERLYALQDPNWNVVAISDTDGTIQERYAYNAYGTPTVLAGDFTPRSLNFSSYAWQYLFTGRRYDPETGLYHYRRWPYGADLGRFPTRDPIGLAALVNPYGYVLANPLNGIDPYGLWKVMRNRQPKAVAVADKQNDTIRTLANYIGLNASEFKSWVTPLGPRVWVMPGPRPIPFSELTETSIICPNQRLLVPNVILAFWFGEYGSRGRAAIRWDESVQVLSDLGFHVIRQVNDLSDLDQPDNLRTRTEWMNGQPLYNFLRQRTKAKELQGLFFSQWCRGPTPLHVRPRPSQGRELQAVVDPGAGDCLRSRAEWPPDNRILTDP